LLEKRWINPLLIGKKKRPPGRRKLLQKKTWEVGRTGEKGGGGFFPQEEKNAVVAIEFDVCREFSTPERREEKNIWGEKGNGLPRFTGATR